MRIYTKTGDDGFTGLLGPGRVPKDTLRVEAYGTVDELNASLGVARAHGLDPRADRLVAQLQDELFVVGSALADPTTEGPFHKAVTSQHVVRLESAIDEMEEELAPLTQFILPGGAMAAAQIHLARTVCRRAERLTVALSRQPHEAVPRDLIVYLNRMSDLLFVLARAVNHRAGMADILWKGP
ncbi:MAG: cob(I)yrinic acid a,c-diamide adenosyltransferase [Isosphaeraceae bacterium]